MVLHGDGSKVYKYFKEVNDSIFRIKERYKQATIKNEAHARVFAMKTSNPACKEHV
jgi:hypothetical protein